MRFIKNIYIDVNLYIEIHESDVQLWIPICFPILRFSGYSD